nr:MAG TPA: adenylosuccinate synthetase [Caudoviricetes sp.]
MDIKIVIGAQYGDEGKGRTVDYFTRECKNGDMAVVLTNGGAQRGHTVVKGDKRHIFHHFGSGTMNGADTIISEIFQVNPMVFSTEWDELRELGFTPNVYVDENCFIATPWDALINQCWETALGDGRFGSCGLGVYEAIIRSKEPEYAITVKEIQKANEENNWIPIAEKLDIICMDYVPSRLHEVLDGRDIPEQFISNFEKDYVLSFLSDLAFFIRHVTVKKFTKTELSAKYKRLVFENAQGLAISQKYYEQGENTTPTYTGLGSDFDVLDSFDVKSMDEFDTEVCYATRWYTTRHGAGVLPGETDVNNLSTKIIDNTNVHNEWQGSIRYAMFDVDRFVGRVMRDLSVVQFVEGKFNLSFAINAIDQCDNKKIHYIMDGRENWTGAIDFANVISENFALLPNFAGCYLGAGDDARYTADRD